MLTFAASRTCRSRAGKISSLKVRPGWGVTMRQLLRMALHAARYMRLRFTFGTKLRFALLSTFQLSIDFCHNDGMQTLRNSKFITKLVLVWFALFIGSAVASTVIKPENLQMVCATGGMMKMVDTSSDDGEVKGSASMDCPLCASVTAPPSPSTVHFEQTSPLAHALQPVAAAHIASVTAPPLPSRGPPALFL